MNNIDKLARGLGVSIEELARRVDMNPHTLRRYARNESQPKPALTLKLAGVFGCDPNEILGFPVSENATLSRIPLYGITEDIPGSDIIDMDRALDHIDRPSFLLSASNAYAVYVGGESMTPRFRSGEIVYVDPAVPIRSGGDVVVQMSDNNKLTAIVKEYTHSDDYLIYLKEFASKEQVSIEKFRITAIHLIRGMYIT